MCLKSFLSFAAMENEVRDRIIVGSDELFMRLGIKSVTMDDIASHLSISKKTIYQHFKDKNELVIAVSKVHMETDQCEVLEISNVSDNAVQELYFISLYIRKHMLKMNPSILFDLKKYHPKAWDLFKEHQRNCIYKTVVANIERGKKEGSFREEVNPEILAVLRMNSIEIGFDPSIYPSSKFNLLEVQMQLFDHFVHGIVTAKGLKQLEQYVKDNQ